MVLARRTNLPGPGVAWHPGSGRRVMLWSDSRSSQFPARCRQMMNWLARRVAAAWEAAELGFQQALSHSRFLLKLRLLLVLAWLACCLPVAETCRAWKLDCMAETMRRWDCRACCYLEAVSYTHLTLPT